MSPGAEGLVNHDCAKSSGELGRCGSDVNGFARSALHDPGWLEELKDSYVAPRGAQARTWSLVRWACDRVRGARGF